MAAGFVLAKEAELCGYLPEHVSLDQAQELDARSENEFPGKEMFHPQVLLRIPCYDLLPVSSFTVVPPLARNGPSGAPTFHELTGGEYKTQEHIHRDMADSRLLAIPAS